MTNPTTPPAEPALSRSLRLGWGIGSLGSTTLINGVSFLALFFFTQVLGIAPALAGTLLFTAKLYDIVTDPLMGHVSDRTRTHWGRRRPWLLAAAVVCPAAFLLLFNLPGATPAAVTTWAAVALVLYATGYTMFNIPYLAMPAEMTSDYHERTRLMSVRVFFASLGILAGGSLAPVLVTVFGGGAGGYRGMSLVLAAVIFAAMLACFLGTRDARHTEHVVTTLGMREQLRLALRNRPFVVLLICKFLHMTGVAVINSTLLYLVTLVIARETAAAAAFGIAATAGTLVSLPLWVRLSRRIGKRNAYFIGVTVYVPALLSWLTVGPGESTVGLVLRGIAIGIATGGLTMTAQAMLPDTIDVDTRRTGLRREATFTAMYSLMEKTAFAFGPLIVGSLLAQAGFDATTGAAQSEPTLRMILLLFAVIPAVLSGLSAAVLLAYSLDRELRAASGS